MLSQTHAAREARVRRAAVRQGYRLYRGRRDNDFGRYMLVDVDTNFAVLGSGPIGNDAELEDVERWLAG